MAFVAQSDLRLYRTLEKILESEQLDEHLHTELFFAMGVSNLKEMVEVDSSLRRSLANMGSKEV